MLIVRISDRLGTYLESEFRILEGKLNKVFLHLCFEQHMP